MRASSCVCVCVCVCQGSAIVRASSCKHVSVTDWVEGMQQQRRTTNSTNFKELEGGKLHYAFLVLLAATPGTLALTRLPHAGLPGPLYQQQHGAGRDSLAAPVLRWLPVANVWRCGLFRGL